MKNRINLLFVCSRNQWRSPTAERIYQDDPRVSVRSRGTTRQAAQRIRSQDIEWAELILVMEKKHRNRIVEDFPSLSRNKAIHVLDIPDDYSFMDPDLIQLICGGAEPLIDAAIVAS